MERKCDHRTTTGRCRISNDTLIPSGNCGMCPYFTTEIQDELIYNNTIVMVSDDGDVWQMADVHGDLEQLRR